MQCIDLCQSDCKQHERSANEEAAPRGSFLRSSAPFIQPDLLPSDWRIVCCSLSLSLSFEHAQLSECIIGFLACTCTHPLCQPQYSELVKYNSLTYWTTKIKKQECERKKKHTLRLWNRTQRVIKIVLYYPASKWGRSDRIHSTSCLYPTDHMAVQSVFIMQVYSTSLVWITECITADFPKSDVTNDHLDDLIR